MKGITLEATRPDHQEFLYELFWNTHPELTGIEGMSDDQMEGLLRLQFDIRQEQLMQLYPNAERNLIFLHGIPVGCIIVDYGRNLRLVEIGLLEPYRGMGIGGYVIRDLIDKAKDLGKDISLQVLWCNKAAYQFYSNLGFTVDHNNDVTYEMRYRYNTGYQEKGNCRSTYK